MTQAFNLAQLANNLNSSGQLDATDGLSGLVTNANLASSGSASSSTFLRGDRTWATAGLQAASQAQAEAGTDNTVGITPLSLRQGLLASGSAPIYACRAWVNFNGQGTVSIRSSGNVSSVTDNGTGTYTLNFATAIQDANYAAVGAIRKNDGTNDGNMAMVLGSTGTAYSTTQLGITTRYITNEGLQDTQTSCIAIFR